MTDLEELFTSATAWAEQGHPAPADAMARLASARRARRVRGLAVLTVPVAAAVVAAVVVAPAVLSGDHHGPETSSLSGRGTAPSSFVALQAGHAGLFDATDGAKRRDLGPAVAVAPGEGGFWRATAKGCASSLSFEPAGPNAVGRIESVPGLITAIAMAPDGRSLAYAVDVPGKTHDDNAVCGGGDLVLLDVGTGAERRWHNTDGAGQISSLAWSPDSSRLVFQVTVCCDASTELKALAPATTAEGPVDKVATLADQPSSCQLTLPAYLADRPVAVRDCEAKTELVAIDARGDLTPLRTLPDHPQGLAVEGDAMLVEGYGDGETPGALVRVDPDGTTTTIAHGLSGVGWVPEAAAAEPTGPAAEPSATPSTDAAAGIACSYPTGTGHGTLARDVGTPPARATDLPGRLTIHTNRGELTVALRSDVTPCTVNSIVFLARAGYFDHTDCHRLTTTGIFVVQCGDPTGLGTGGPGYTSADEALEGTTYPAGTVAMANSGPDTNGSQFFLVYGDTKLDAHYTAFGRILSGVDVLRAVAAAGSEPAGDGKPVLRLTITGVTVS